MSKVFWDYMWKYKNGHFFLKKHPTCTLAIVIGNLLSLFKSCSKSRQKVILGVKLWVTSHMLLKLTTPTVILLENLHKLEENWLHKNTFKKSGSENGKALALLVCRCHLVWYSVSNVMIFTSDFVSKNFTTVLICVPQEKINHTGFEQCQGDFHD